MNDKLLEKVICRTKVLCMDCDRMSVEDGKPMTNDHIIAADGIVLYFCSSQYIYMCIILRNVHVPVFPSTHSIRHFYALFHLASKVCNYLVSLSVFPFISQPVYRI